VRKTRWVRKEVTPNSCATHEVSSTRIRCLDPERQYIGWTDDVESALHFERTLQPEENGLTEADAQLAAIAAQAHAIYGAFASAPTGVIHIASAVRTNGRLHVIKIQPGAPVSSTDSFVLHFWRAHYDALLTTGQILRAEPSLSYALSPDLTRYREQVLGKSGNVRCVILTRGLQLSAEHPVFRETSGVELSVFAPPQNVAELRKVLGDRAEVVGLPQLDARAALDFLQRTGSATIGVEAGPSVARTLYGADARVEHLMLSICEAELPAHGVGGALPADAELFAGMRQISEAVREEESGRWRFQHWQTVESLRGLGALQNG
jgi:riboflavin biosynthesis pyrimidine reductase